MDFRLSRHAEWEMARRGIPLGSVPFEDATMYLLRVVVDEDDEPPAIITVYRTSKIVKY
jgi:hypothetical protein